MFQFIKKDSGSDVYPPTEVILTIKDEDITHSELAKFFEQFLRACGYHFNTGLYSGEKDE